MAPPSPFHTLRARALSGQDVDLGVFRGSVVLVVNTACHCRLSPQLDGLEDLFGRHRAEGFVVLGFPCNQFGGLEPGGALEIEAHCLLHHGISFPMFEKTLVNGRHAHPLFRWLKTSLPGRMGKSVKWNFTKFLLDRDGRPLRRYAPLTPPRAIEPDLIRALREKQASVEVSSM